MPHRESGFTLIELAIAVAIIATVVLVAVTGVLRSKAAANEASAMTSIREIHRAQNAYATICGRGGFATSLLVLGHPSAFVSPDLANQVNPFKSSYQFRVVPGAGSTAGPADCHNMPTITAYYAWATPHSLISGSRSFAVTADGIVWTLAGGSAPAEPFAAPAEKVQ